MKLADLIGREPVVPWAGAAKIPWDEPGFSARMLREHLSQLHDRASRRSETIDQHVSWLHETVLAGSRGRVLDLGCGPGFYTGRLARLGHRCVGIDFSPASIEHAKLEAEQESLPCEYRLEDLRDADFGARFDLALFCFGELNTFHPDDAREILARARRSLRPTGALVLEVHPEAHVRAIGAQGVTWFTSSRSVFSDHPHLCLRECMWHAPARVATERHLVVSLESAQVDTYVSTMQAYSDSGYASLLRDVGFASSERHASLAGDSNEGKRDLFVLVARAS